MPPVRHGGARRNNPGGHGDVADEKLGDAPEEQPPKHIDSTG